VESLIFAAAVSCPEKRLHDPGFKQQLVFYGPTHNLTWCMLGLASRLSPRGAAWQTMAIFSTHNTQESFSELDDWDVEKISRFYRKKSSRRGALNDQSHTVGKELLNAISQPTLVIHSREDRSVPFSHAQWLLENIPQAELCESGFTGHFFWIGPNFTSVCQQMTEFLQISISR
jgi:pimeloyl-ACP methyl ester carboxylesterase